MAALSTWPETWVLSLFSDHNHHSILSGTLPWKRNNLLEHAYNPLSISNVQALHIFIHSTHRTVLQNRCCYYHPYFADTEFEAQKD